MKTCKSITAFTAAAFAALAASDFGFGLTASDWC